MEGIVSMVPSEPNRNADVLAKTIDFPFPLRPDLIAHLWLPRDLTLEEVTKLHKFMLAICEIG
jgi:hypothetical protein